MIFFFPVFHPFPGLGSRCLVMTLLVGHHRRQTTSRGDRLQEQLSRYLALDTSLGDGHPQDSCLRERNAIKQPKAVIFFFSFYEFLFTAATALLFR